MTRTNPPPAERKLFSFKGDIKVNETEFGGELLKTQTTPNKDSSECFLK